MQAQDFECNIARAQMARYLAGEPFSPEALKDLNEHITKCNGCSEALEERRTKLYATLRSQPAPENVLSEAEIGMLQNVVDDAAYESEPVPEPEKREAIAVPTNFAKPLIYSSALAAVLVAMSLFVQNPTSIFGERAAAKANIVAAKPPASKPAVAAATALYKAEEAFAPAKVPVDQLRPLTGVLAKRPKLGGQIGNVGSNGYPAVTVYGAKKVRTASSTKAKNHVRVTRIRNTNSTKAPRPSRGIVVYDSDGNVITEPQGANK